MIILLSLTYEVSTFADTSWPTLSDGRIEIDLNGVRIAVATENADSIHFYLSQRRSGYLTVRDFLRDPDGARRLIEEATWISVEVYRLNGLIPNKPEKETHVDSVGIFSGHDPNCEAWKPTYKEYRDVFLNSDLVADKFGWMSQTASAGQFVKFLDDSDRLNSRYHAINCDPVFGRCRSTVCRENLTTSFNFHGFVPGNGFSRAFNVGEFDATLIAAKKALEYLLIERRVDLTFP